MASAHPEPRAVRITVQRRETRPWVTVLGLVAVAAATTMAVFGLPPVDLHGPLHHLGIMDPLCGGTRAAMLTARGELALAWYYNPLGVLTVLAAAAVVLRAVVGLLTRRWVTVRLRLRRDQVPWVVGFVLVGVAVVWIRQQLHADLLMGGASEVMSRL